MVEAVNVMAVGLSREGALSKAIDRSRTQWIHAATHP
jgi:hypothetical protein